jgi:hypothetical protein
MPAHEPDIVAERQDLGFDGVDQGAVIAIGKICSPDRTPEQYIAELREFCGLVDKYDMARRMPRAV